MAGWRQAKERAADCAEGRHAELEDERLFGVPTGHAVCVDCGETV